MLSPNVEDWILKELGASALLDSELVQELWSGYGQILRLSIEGTTQDLSSVVLKQVRLPESSRHPRGWNSSRSHQRKIRSYQVEAAWYREQAAQCDSGCRVPRCLAQKHHADEVLLLLEDLDILGFPARTTSATASQMHACLDWLANFHATFLGCSAPELWTEGTYWHLATRPDELAALDDGPLKRSVVEIAKRLQQARYQTLLHGDAKLANFCFSRQGEAKARVAAVDFQYVGGGCGMKDVAYFIGSCLDETQAESQEGALLNFYFERLGAALTHKGNGTDFLALEREWRSLYKVAWTDFYRFLQGWSPGHWKIHSYTKRLAREVLRDIIPK